VKPPRPNRLRDSWAGSARPDRTGERLRVAGWVHRRRDHGGLIFIDLRDRTGLLQLVFRPEEAPEAHAAAEALRPEDVVTVAGKLVPREEGTVNPSLPTGEVEINVAEVEQLADAETPPFAIDEDAPVDEALRLRYRYLDLRRQHMREAFELRHRVVQRIHRHLDDLGFLELETPMLTRSTPEGARDFLVPSRMQPGDWYALPQSPQLFKQLFMVAGFERYYQVVRCFRDEDLRADRQPEFTQLDMELSFVDEDDVIEVCDELLRDLLGAADVDLELPLDRITYGDALLRYGTDRPDRRPGMEIADLGEAFAGSEFRVFAEALGSGGVIRGFRVPTGTVELPRRRLDELTERARGLGAQGLVWAVVEDGSGGWRSPVAKFLSEEERLGVNVALAAEPGDTLLIVADAAPIAARVLGELRLALAPPASGHDLLWVVDFPMFEWNEDERRWDALHHPFTAPVAPRAGLNTSAADLDSDPGSWRSRAYDVVMDGLEIGGGSIRINRPDVQSKVFDALGLPPEEARARFGFLLDALRYGAPPHGGIAFGLDRVCALLAGRDSIREVIAFPKTASGADPLTGAPAPVDARQLRELGVRPAGAPPRPAAPAGAGEQAPPPIAPPDQS
jgi:aspartyl-tRNA synthetase